MWATAVSTNAENGRVIIWRYIQDFPREFKQSLQPYRVILVWKYQSDSGQPGTAEHQRMDEMEDLIQPNVEGNGFASLALVSTGENLREWTYYARSDDDFIARVNSALGGKPAFLIEIHAAKDSTWKTYWNFRSGLKK
jgi:hypothetical protein